MVRFRPLIGMPLTGICLAALAGCALPLEKDPFTGFPPAGPVDQQAARVLGPASTPLPDPSPPATTGKESLNVPPQLPGASTPSLKLPPPGPGAGEDRDKAIKRLYPDLAALPPVHAPVPGPHGQPLTLGDLQQIGQANSPLVRRALADVEIARGTAIQAGLPPNPTFGYEGDQIQPGHGPTHSAGQQGVFLQQLIKTGGKLGLARAAAGMDLLNAELALRAAQVELSSRVRSSYFAVLVAQENILLSRALAALADSTYRLQIKMVRSSIAAAYEPLQLYVLAVQARNNLIQAEGRYVTAWRQLAAALGTPDMPPTDLAGRADAPSPLYNYDEARDHILEAHTDVKSAENLIQRAQYHLRLAEVSRLPDVSTSLVLQHDYADGNDQFSLQVGLVNLPVFDRNQGNIHRAHAEVARAHEDLAQTRNDLIHRLAEAFERYQTSRLQVEGYREQILANQVRVYRAVQARYHAEPDKVDFVDIVNAQQTLAASLSTYLVLLGTQWQATVDVAALLQTDDLYVPVEPTAAGACTPLVEMLGPTVLPGSPAGP